MSHLMRVCWGPNTGPQEVQYTGLTTELSLQPLDLFLCCLC